MADVTVTKFNSRILNGNAIGQKSVDIISTDFRILKTSNSNIAIPFYVKAITTEGIIKVKDYYGSDVDITITELNKYDIVPVVKVYKAGTTAEGIIAAF